MPIRRLGLVIVVVVMGAVAIVVALTRSPEYESEFRVSAGVYAYMRVELGESALDTKSELVVMDGTEQIGSTVFGFVGTSPMFTADGQYVYTVPLGDELVVISVESGEVKTAPCQGCGDRHLDCQCQAVVPIGGSQIAWLDGENHLVLMDLSADSPTPQQTDIMLPTEDGFLDEQVSPNLIAGADGVALAAYPHGSLPGDDLMPVYLMTLDDEPRQLNPDRPDSIEEAVFSPDGTQVAMTGNQESACATVTVVDVTSGKGQTAPVSAEPGTECGDHDVYIDAMWWDQDGTLNVYFQAGGESPTAKDGQRQFKSDKWVESTIDPTAEERQLSAGWMAIRDTSSLYIEINGERTKIDTEVRYVTAAPPTD